MTPSFPDSYWENPGIEFQLNPRVAADTSGLADFVRSGCGIDSAVILATSGTGIAGPKFVLLENSALLASAAAVNRHLGVESADRWLAALASFHVGGLGVFARAHLSGSGVQVVEDPLKWDRSGTEFVTACRRHEITLSALTPIHLHDLVAAGAESPPSLRGLLIGGGRLAPSLAARALELGWPLWLTYGMTETCSQVATSTEPAEAVSGLLPVLSGWEVRDGDPLEVRGPALFSGYLSRVTGSGEWRLESPFDGEGWFRTSDVVELDLTGRRLRFRSRIDDRVKVLGELVSVSRLEHVLDGGNGRCAVIPMPDERRGHRFVAVCERGSAPLLEEANSQLAPFERIDELIEVDELPRTAVGKIARGEIRALIPEG